MMANATSTFTLVVHVDPQTPPGTFFTNRATTTNADDPNDENNTATSTGSTPPPPTGDVFVNKTGPNTSGAGTDVVYNILGQGTVLVLAFIAVKFIYGRLGQDVYGIIIFNQLVAVLVTLHLPFA